MSLALTSPCPWKACVRAAFQLTHCDLLLVVAETLKYVRWVCSTRGTQGETRPQVKIVESSPASVSMIAIARRGFVGRIFSVPIPILCIVLFPPFPLRCFNFSVKETASHLFTQVVLELFPNYFEMLTIRCFSVPVSEKQNHNIYNVLSTSPPRIPFTQFTFLTLLICSSGPTLEQDHKLDYGAKLFLKPRYQILQWEEWEWQLANQQLIACDFHISEVVFGELDICTAISRQGLFLTQLCWACCYFHEPSPGKKGPNQNALGGNYSNYCTCKWLYFLENIWLVIVWLCILTTVDLWILDFAGLELHYWLWTSGTWVAEIWIVDFLACFWMAAPRPTPRCWSKAIATLIFLW